MFLEEIFPKPASLLHEKLAFFVFIMFFFTYHIVWSFLSAKNFKEDNSMK
jgi:hypothetical protein